MCGFSNEMQLMTMQHVYGWVSTMWKANLNVGGKSQAHLKWIYIYIDTAFITNSFNQVPQLWCILSSHNKDDGIYNICSRMLNTPCLAQLARWAVAESKFLTVYSREGQPMAKQYKVHVHVYGGVTRHKHEGQNFLSLGWEISQHPNTVCSWGCLF